MSDLMFTAADALYRKTAGFRSPQISLKRNVSKQQLRHIFPRGKGKLRQRHADLERQRRLEEMDARTAALSQDEARMKRTAGRNQAVTNTATKTTWRATSPTGP